MEISITDHAALRMLERVVSYWDIQFVLGNFQTSFTTPANSTILQGRFGNGMVLKVWVAGRLPLVEPVIINTVAWMEVSDVKRF